MTFLQMAAGVILMAAIFATFSMVGDYLAGRILYKLGKKRRGYELVARSGLGHTWLIDHFFDCFGTNSHRHYESCMEHFEECEHAHYCSEPSCPNRELYRDLED